MLEGRGIDYESIGYAMGVRRQVNAIYAQAEANMAEANRISARHYATAEGRRAQIRALYDALREADPSHPALQPTGLVYADGDIELAYERAFGPAYDDVARRNGIPLSQRAMTPADQAFARVMAEPIEERRTFLCRRFFWRGEEHRSCTGAERARQRAAAAAREAVHGR